MELGFAKCRENAKAEGVVCKKYRGQTEFFPGPGEEQNRSKIAGKRRNQYVPEFSLRDKKKKREKNDYEFL